MEILHLTDLHVTAPNASLDEIWGTVHGCLGERRFDFVVVSGDLSQAAEKHEYDNLVDFWTHQIRPLLKVDDVRRAIFVPGNHDVSWSHDLGPRVDVTVATEPLLAEIKALRKTPSNSPLRGGLLENGRYELLRVEQSTYRNRFQNVQKHLLDRIYKVGVPPCCRDCSRRRRQRSWRA